MQPKTHADKNTSSYTETEVNTCLSWISELTWTSQISQWNVLFCKPEPLLSCVAWTLSLDPGLGYALMGPAPFRASSIVLCFEPGETDKVEGFLWLKGKKRNKSVYSVQLQGCWLHWSNRIFQLSQMRTWINLCLILRPKVVEYTSTQWFCWRYNIKQGCMCILSFLKTLFWTNFVICPCLLTCEYANVRTISKY